MDEKHTTRGSRTLPSGELHKTEPAKAERRTSVLVVRNPTKLSVVRDPITFSGFIPAWEELAAAALEPNVFYEHWMLLPALEACGAGEDICFVLVLIRDPHNHRLPAKLGGLFPLQRVRHYKQIPAPTFRLWRHAHCYLATPLIRADAARECLTEFFRWLLSNDEGAGLIELSGVRGDGPFHRALVDVSNDLNLLTWVSEIHTRGLLRKERDCEHAELEISRELRRTLRRKEKRLSERGPVEHVILGPRDDIRCWIDDFINLEASGWKGERGSALADSEANRRFFTRIANSAFRRGRLLMIGVDFDGRPIARRCSFTAGQGSFAFKTTYDEEFAHFSPGMMLELDNLRQFQALPDVRWMDSCTASDNFTINRLWKDRVTIESLAVGGGPWSELAISTAPMLRWLRRRVPWGH